MLPEWPSPGSDPRERGDRDEYGLGRVRGGLADRLAKSLAAALKAGGLRQRAAALFVGDLAGTFLSADPEEARLFAERIAKPLTPTLVAGASGGKDASLRGACVLALCKMRTDGKVLLPVLTRALAAREAAERQAAAAGLLGLANRPARDPRLADKDALVRRLAAVVVAAAGKGLADKDALVRQRCLAALTHTARTLVRDLHLLRPGEAPGARGGPGVDPREERQIQQFLGALLSLGRALDAQVPAIRKSVTHADLAVCLEAHSALEGIAEARNAHRDLAANLPPLPRKEDREEKEDRPPQDTRKKATGRPKAIPAAPFTHIAGAAKSVVPSLTHKEVRVRLAALYVLETLGHDSVPAVEAVGKSLADRNRFVRWGAARALGNAAPHATKALTALAGVLDDDSRDVRVTAALALEAHGAAAKGTVKQLAGVVKSGDEEMKGLAIRTLVAIGKPAAEAAPALTAALKEKAPAIRAAAAQALGRLAPADKAGRAALLEALEDADAAVRQAAAAALLEE
jgi:HEAT repeat protein